MDPSQKIFSLGIVIFFVFGCWEVLRYNLQHHYYFTNELMTMSWMPFGALLFILALVIAYIVYVLKMVSDKAEKDVLAELAFKDSLTGLFNRTKCEQIFDVLDQDGENYAIISIDMNGLKVVNDSYGHANGDKQIRRFAEVLKEAVKELGTVIRMGGDEFLVIIRESHLPELHLIKEHMDYLTKARSKGLPVALEASYGVALKNEFGDCQAKEVYRSADERMYIMKKNSKSKLVRK